MIQLSEELSNKHLRATFCKGDVLFWEGFPGKEKARDSYFVLLTGCIEDHFLVARASRQLHHYVGSSAERLRHDIVLIKSGEAEIFTDDTILDLTWRRFFTVEQLAKLLGAEVKKIGVLSDALIVRINEYVRMSVTLSEREKEMILKS